MLTSPAFIVTINSTTVRLLMLLFVFMAMSPVFADTEWRRDSVREQQIADRIYQWQKRGKLSVQYCWQHLRIDDSVSGSEPEHRILAAAPTLTDAQIKADYVRQQMVCLLQQNPLARHKYVEQLRRHQPSLPIKRPHGAGSVTDSYVELLAALMTLHHLQQHDGEKVALDALLYWQHGRRAPLYRALRWQQSPLLALHQSLHHEVIAPWQKLASD